MRDRRVAEFFPEKTQTRQTETLVFVHDTPEAPSVRSKASGQYRFKSLDSGKYKVRVRKDGFAAEEASVDAKAAADDQCWKHRRRGKFEALHPLRQSDEQVAKHARFPRECRGDGAIHHELFDRGDGSELLRSGDDRPRKAPNIRLACCSGPVERGIRFRFYRPASDCETCSLSGPRCCLRCPVRPDEFRGRSQKTFASRAGLGDSASPSSNQG